LCTGGVDILAHFVRPSGMISSATCTEADFPPMDPDRIKAIRVSLGLTQREFADALGLKLRAITYWEAGAPGRDPKGPALILLHMLERHPKRLKEVLELSDAVKQEQDYEADEKGRSK
jgi:DNA-binding transcriptional regulator YiaG